jgi:hypothetical protein
MKKQITIELTEDEYWRLLRRSVETGINHQDMVRGFVADLTHFENGEKAHNLANQYLDEAFPKREESRYNEEDLRVMANLDKKITWRADEIAPAKK